MADSNHYDDDNDDGDNIYMFIKRLKQSLI